jgi:hypothetical protein
MVRIFYISLDGGIRGWHAGEGGEIVGRFLVIKSVFLAHLLGGH